MLKLRVVNAHEGDCFILLYGKPSKPRALLVDGGPKNTFGPHLRRTLETLGVPGLDAVVLSHVDNDHVTGLLELFAAIRDRPDGEAPPIAVSDLWLNSFGTIIDNEKTVARRLEGVLQQMAAQNRSMSVASAALSGIKEGHKLAVMALQLEIPVNRVLGGQPFIADSTDPIELDGLEIDIVGPTEENLDALAAEWQAWLDKQVDRIGRGQLHLAAMADKSVPNLSSIQLHVRGNGKTLLLTGDGRGDHLLEALEEAELLDADGTIELDLLKVPHHGSDRNVTRRFFERVRAKTYVISANGKHGNPDLPTLQWIVESRPAEEPITLVLTNRTDTVDKLERAFPPDELGYSLVIRDPDQDFIDVTLA